MERWIQLFIRSAGIILLAAALERFCVAIGDSQVLSLLEPVLGMPLRYTVLIVGGLELGVALLCLFGRRLSFQLGWVAWLTVNYWVYRIGLLMMQCHQQGTCIGSLTDPLHLARGTGGLIASLNPVYLLLGSCASLLWVWLGGRVLTSWQMEKKEFIKMSCPTCGRRIQFALLSLGRRIPCPQCQTAITLCKPEQTLKVSCFFCQGHIEFPAHAIGEKMPCPHCKMDITLKEQT